MVQTTLTITGGIGEVVQTIRQLATPDPDTATAAVTTQPPAPAPPPPPQPVRQSEPPAAEPPPSQPASLRQNDAPTAATAAAPLPSWTTETAATLLSGVTDHAAQIIRYLAEHNPPEAPAAQVRSDLGLDPNQIRNARISAGNRARRNGLPTPSIAGRNDTLSIHPDLAQAIRTALEQHPQEPDNRIPAPPVGRQPLTRTVAPRLDRSIWGLQSRTNAHSDTGQ